ncbi:DUF2190 family protein [Nocardioides speluncae]|uniref:DUF2190 family protein n=1 Tax=Nocardioides speluncae TaxID=2670337 RepID=UPI000D69812F|nr:DUF2190 family protein [Nocardioides speluncae]
MAKNREYERGTQIPLNVSAVNGSGVGDLVKSGDPGAVGQLPFVALIDEGTDGIATCQTDGVFRLAVFGHDGTANAAIAVGDLVVWDNTGGTLEKTPGSASSVRFGYALGAVASGATTTIPVKLGY